MNSECCNGGIFFTSFMSGNCSQKTALNMVCASVTC
jgi:hypothetical protein